MITVLFAACMLALIGIGFSCARHLGALNVSLWIRLAVLAPCLSAFATLGAMTQGDYVAYTPDIFRALATIAVYFVLESVISGKSWLHKEKA